MLLKGEKEGEQEKQRKKDIIKDDELTKGINLILNQNLRSNFHLNDLKPIK